MTNAFTASGLLGNLLRDEIIAAEFDTACFSQRMLAFETAWTRALLRSGVVTDADATAALAAIERFAAAPWPATLGEGSGRDGLPVPAMVAALRTGLSDGAARAIHSGATSQDVMDTAAMLTCLSVASILEDRLTRVVAAIGALEMRFGDRPLMARTRMQAAIPATVALRLGAWRRPIEAHLERLGPLRTELGRVQIGGAVGLRDAPAGAADDVTADVADALGLTLGPVWQTDRSAVVGFGHWLSLVAGSLGKIGQDVALMAQQGVDEIMLGGGGGSSAMSHKRNPVAAEAMVALARFVGGQQSVLAQAMIHEQERSGAAWALEWLTLPLMAEATGAALRHAQSLLALVERIGTGG